MELQVVLCDIVTYCLTGPLSGGALCWWGACRMGPDTERAPRHCSPECQEIDGALNLPVSSHVRISPTVGLAGAGI